VRPVHYASQDFGLLPQGTQAINPALPSSRHTLGYPRVHRFCTAGIAAGRSPRYCLQVYLQSATATAAARTAALYRYTARWVVCIR
jgi:hypothetical protein